MCNTHVTNSTRIVPDVVVCISPCTDVFGFSYIGLVIHWGIYSHS